LTGASEVFIALIMEAVITSETSVSIYQTAWRNIAEDSHFHSHRCENLKSYPSPVLVMNLCFPQYPLIFFFEV
jgi:hypothetical protein